MNPKQVNRLEKYEGRGGILQNTVACRVLDVEYPSVILAY